MKTFQNGVSCGMHGSSVWLWPVWAQAAGSMSGPWDEFAGLTPNSTRP